MPVALGPRQGTVRLHRERTSWSLCKTGCQSSGFNKRYGEEDMKSYIRGLLVSYRIVLVFHQVQLITEFHQGGQLQSLQEHNARILVEQTMFLTAAAVSKLKLAFIISFSHHYYRFPSPSTRTLIGVGWLPGGETLSFIAMNLSLALIGQCLQ